MQEAPGLPSPVALSTAQSVARVFLKDTGVWTKKLTVPLLANNTVLDFSALLTAGEEVSRIVSMVYDGRLIPEKDIDAFLTHVNRTQSTAKTPYIFTQNQNVFEVYPAPDSNINLLCTVELTTTLDSNYIDDAVEERVREGIVSGALYRLLRQDGKPWTNKQGSMEYREVYYNETLRAKTKLLPQSFNLRNFL